MDRANVMVVLIMSMIIVVIMDMTEFEAGSSHYIY